MTVGFTVASPLDFSGFTQEKALEPQRLFGSTVETVEFFLHHLLFYIYSLYTLYYAFFLLSYLLIYSQFKKTNGINGKMKKLLIL